MNAPAPEPTQSTRDVAAELGVCETVLRGYVARGMKPAKVARVQGAHHRWSRADVEILRGLIAFRKSLDTLADAAEAAVIRRSDNATPGTLIVGVKGDMLVLAPKGFALAIPRVGLPAIAFPLVSPRP